MAWRKESGKFFSKKEKGTLTLVHGWRFLTNCFVWTPVARSPANLPPYHRPNMSDHSFAGDDDDDESDYVLKRRSTDVAILDGTTPFVITCQQAEAYKKWEQSLSDAVKEYSTWSSFRRSANVMEYFRMHLGEKVRFLKGDEGARNDYEACWEVMTEIEIMSKSKEAFHNLVKARRRVENWHGVPEEKITRETEDVAFVQNDSRLAQKCKSTKSYALFEEVVKKAVTRYKKSWEAFRKSGGINCYFWKELGDCRMLRARNHQATSDADADWEVLCGEPLTAFLEKQFKHYACLMEDPVEPEIETSSAKLPAANHPDPDPPKEAKKRKSKSDDEKETAKPKKKKTKTKRSKDSSESDTSDDPAEAKPPPRPPTPPPPPSRKMVVSVFLMSKNLAISLGRLDVKVKTKWKLNRLRQEIDPVLRQKNFLTMDVPWEFYLYNSGTFISEEFEKKMSIDQYLLEANEEESIAIRVVS